MNPLSILRIPGLDILISPEDAPRIAQHSWHVFKAGRKTNRRILIVTRINGRRVKLHRFILGVGPGVVVDHVNGVTLDNRRENLRSCARHENCRNLAKFTRKCTSQYKGVYFTKGRRWVAYISVDKKRTHLGSFGTELEAAQKYDSAAVLYHGEFARINFPQPLAALLGLKVEDKVTGLRGVVASISFDLYGCVQAIVNPGLDKDGKLRRPERFLN